MLIDLNQYNNPFPVSLLLLHIRLAQSPSMVEKRPYPKPSSVWPFSGLTHLPRCQKAGPKGFPMITPKRYFTSTTHIDHHIVIFSLCKLFVILTVFFFISRKNSNIDHVNHHAHRPNIDKMTTVWLVFCNLFILNYACFDLRSSFRRRAHWDDYFIKPLGTFF